MSVIRLITLVISPATQVTEQEHLAGRLRHMPLLWAGWVPMEGQRQLWLRRSLMCSEAGCQV